MLDDLKKIRSVRKLRANAKRQHLASELSALSCAQDRLHAARTELTQLEESVNTLRREGLTRLVGANLQSIDDLIRFDASKARIQSRIKTANDLLHTRHNEKIEQSSRCNAAHLALIIAEKKLVAIEEWIDREY